MKKKRYSKKLKTFLSLFCIAKKDSKNLRITPRLSCLKKLWRKKRCHQNDTWKKKKKMIQKVSHYRHHFFFTEIFCFIKKYVLYTNKKN